jgi:hypothetical protein
MRRMPWGKSPVSILPHISSDVSLAVAGTLHATNWTRPARSCAAAPTSCSSARISPTSRTASGAPRPQGAYLDRLDTPQQREQGTGTLPAMSNHLIAARSFMASHARVLDRRRFELLFDGADAAPVLAALRAYRNRDGGYGHGLEPDLRAPESQPAAALHAFEVFADVAPVTAPEAAELCDWLDAVALPDGGLPLALPLEDTSGCAPFWAQADPQAFSLQITAIVAAHANRVAAHDPAVAGHPWLARATKRCLAAIDALEDAPAAYELAFAVRLLDAVHDHAVAAPELLARLGEYIPDDGRLRVVGGLPDEALRPLDLAPEPGRPARAIIDEAAVAVDLERLASEQDEDGGWSVDYQSYSPAAALEWRGYATVRALSVLRDNAMIDAPAQRAERVREARE